MTWCLEDEQDTGLFPRLSRVELRDVHAATILKVFGPATQALRPWFSQQELLAGAHQGWVTEAPGCSQPASSVLSPCGRGADLRLKLCSIAPSDDGTPPLQAWDGCGSRWS